MSLFSDDTIRPLADRVRPGTIHEVIGHTDIIGPGTALRSMLDQSKPASMILWGPPGSGKTTLARLFASSGNHAFIELSAVTSGLPEVKKVIEAALARRKLGQSTVLFVDEIHRFNKVQQDAFLPYVENGAIVLIGATTENPSIEIIGALLSRSRVVVLKKLDAEQMHEVLLRGLGQLPDKQLEPAAAQHLVQCADGDARVALTALEGAAALTGALIETHHVKQALGTVGVKYDKSGEYHFNLMSAYIKSMRGGDVDAALYYMVRIIDGGEDPKYIARRLVVFASEDIGLANDTMLSLTIATYQAVERIGLPECKINLSHATIACAKSKKDRSAYDALQAASAAVKQHPGAEVPLHIRNAPTPLLKSAGYGKDYVWKAGFKHVEGFLPIELSGAIFFNPSSQDC